MIVSRAVAFRTVMSANSMAPAVSVQLSPCAIVAVAFVGVGVAIGGVTGPIFTIVMTVELQLIHDPIEFGFHLAVILIDFDLQS